MDDEQDTKNLHERNVALNGKAWHLLKLAEECNELSDAIMKYFTKGGDLLQVESEAADVKIALAHFEVLYPG